MTTPTPDPYPYILSLHTLRAFLEWFPRQPEYRPESGPGLCHGLRGFEQRMLSFLPQMTRDVTGLFGDITVQEVAAGTPLPGNISTSPDLAESARRLAALTDTPVLVKWLVIDSFIDQRLTAALQPIAPVWSRFLRETGWGLPAGFGGPRPA